ncbi:tRNA (guanosine(37)-N1)-methyltransferase TrmD [Clostridium saccharobutylicum]|uniref:tRNA (guanine-N(1)-)-methyltransferase n=1 Tax=Clostridium saccharobutylicum DSM 13864 TaxID=1345695 RepID=U5MPJ2_CLOSA|nr:tRNA (guanosine(37)-N1)-methyltransferase TrmD [Clostridium saccharobutylicum]AGX42403.1 tRNA (guanine-N(1)-)-methyltransferase TrmD [Clostridium saccharobutylicum DSM 13864]AQR89685.1 tRNA (guanine-N(1)-)-methyltransferase [Clostridium saccharobutylicum]AQR99587.1 tRNA (guanine-N(1)-)-methyltransferase [Clostridium saccharobutylicum]AQS09317.1 tRNA (guanine-N(1)-)-methyltransferase [Clostridium saccharobutylicum]AQS13573.1 tRNA (guanine-N(1)-)-methyltransferase [Clostridium saccharobutylic
MKISILTLFPEMFTIFDHSIIGRARQNNIVNLNLLNIRDYTLNKHRKVDDYPYGGGAGMVMAPQPIIDTIRHAKETNSGKVIFLGPRGKTFNQETAKKLSKEDNLIFLCGHYEGIDERVYKHIDMEISLGDFILTGGEMAAIPVIDSILRLIPGVLGKEESFMEESFSDGLLEYPQYTRPEAFQGDKVPDVLLSGHHENIRKWRRLQSLELTKERRPDLYKNIILTKEDVKILKSSNKK